MTQRSIIVGVEGGGGQAQVKTQTLLDYAGHHRPPEGDPAKEPGAFQLQICPLLWTQHRAEAQLVQL